jgi:hypothetical protein
MKRLLLIFGLLSFFTCLTVPLTASAAFDPFEAVKCDDSNAHTAVCEAKGNDSSQNPLTGTNGLIIKISNIVAYVAGAAAVIIFIVGGINFMTAGGDSNKVASARSTIMGAIIGLVVIVLSRVIIGFVVSRL